jgi:hypothetical protein
MGQSLVKNYVHIIYSTKHRQALIDNAIESIPLKNSMNTINPELSRKSSERSLSFITST